MQPWIGITLGDVTGVGPEVTLKALAAEPDDGTRFLLIGDPASLARANIKLQLPIEPFRGPGPGQRFAVLQPTNPPVPADARPGCAAAALAAVAWLRDGAQRCLRGELAALVTAPVSKAAIIRAGQPFVGQTEFLSELAGTRRTAMMLLGTDEQGRWLRVTLATTHVAIRHLVAALTREKVELAIELAGQACAQLDLSRARVGVCGLNPHAGEGGEIGTEEITLIGPAIAAARRKGTDASGPLAADTAFHQALGGDYEVIVAMFHDQGLPPLKLVAFNTGVNWTLGLPFIRTSPDHGPAYDIVGTGRADPASMQAAIRLAKQLIRRRS